MAITVKVLNMSGNEVGSVELNENIFALIGASCLILDLDNR